MARNFIIRTAFEAKDGITKRFGLMTRAAARFGSGATKAFRNAARSAGRFNKVTTGFLKAQVIGKGIGLLTQGIASVTQGFIAFDKASIGATVRFKDIGPEAANFNEQLKLIKKSARDAGSATQFTAAQSAEALDFLARAGFSSAEAMGSLRSMIDLATSTGEDFAQVADQSSDLLGAFGLNADNAADKINNLNRLNDVLVKTANSANVTMEDMFETMKIAGPVATSLGIELEEVAALTAVMGNSGIKGSQGATALKNAMLNLATQKKPVMDMLDSIGAGLITGKDGSLDFTATLEGITKATKDLGKTERTAVFSQIFGKLSIAGVSNLAANLKNVKQFREELLKAGLTSQKTAEIMRTSIDAKLKSLGSAATEAGFKILNAFQKDGKSGIDSLTEAIRNADMGPFIESLKVMASLLGDIAGFVRDIGGGLGILAAKGVTAFENRQADSVGESSFEPSNFFKGLFGTEDQLAIAPPALTPSPFQSGGQGGGSATGGFTDTPAPNKAEAQAKAQQAKFNGTLNINGAPAGSSVETSTNTAGLELNLGFN